MEVSRVGPVYTIGQEHGDRLIQHNNNNHNKDEEEPQDQPEEFILYENNTFDTTNLMPD